jgi:DNA-binding MarR family transcriptional regulator
MATLKADMDTLERAMRLLGQALKKPQQWARITAESGVQLDRPSAAILRTLIINQPRQLRVQDVAHELGIESPSVTRKTQLLEEMGYISRQPDARDKRAVSLKVTAAGHEVTDRLWAAQRQTLLSVLQDWPAQERHQLVELLERFSRQLNETL